MGLMLPCCKTKRIRSWAICCRNHRSPRNRALRDAFGGHIYHISLHKSISKAIEGDCALGTAEDQWCDAARLSSEPGYERPPGRRAKAATRGPREWQANGRWTEGTWAGGPTGTPGRSGQVRRGLCDGGAARRQGKGAGQGRGDACLEFDIGRVRDARACDCPG